MYEDYESLDDDYINEASASAIAGGILIGTALAADTTPGKQIYHDRMGKSIGNEYKKWLRGYWKTNMKGKYPNFSTLRREEKYINSDGKGEKRLTGMKLKYLKNDTRKKREWYDGDEKVCEVWYRYKVGKNQNEKEDAYAIWTVSPKYQEFEKYYLYNMKADCGFISKELENDINKLIGVKPRKESAEYEDDLYNDEDEYNESADSDDVSMIFIYKSAMKQYHELFIGDLAPKFSSLKKEKIYFDKYGNEVKKGTGVVLELLEQENSKTTYFDGKHKICEIEYTEKTTDNYYKKRKSFQAKYNVFGKYAKFKDYYRICMYLDVGFLSQDIEKELWRIIKMNRDEMNSRKRRPTINDFYSEAEKEEMLEEKINKLEESLANIEKKNTRGFESDAQTSDEVDELNEKIKKYKEQLENLQ
jgi:hypothetical protein